MTHSTNFHFIRQVEEKHLQENQLLQAVAQGQIDNMQEIMDILTHHHLEKYIASPIRNTKTHAIIMNTLLRKAAESGGVSVYRLHQVFIHYLKEIDAAKAEKAILFIMKNMAHKYALLVKKQSLKGYSPLIRKVLIHIDEDLSSDLSLRVHAKALHVNPSYLSSMFRKEMGTTLTDYVTRKRIEHACFLLDSTDWQIQTIAEHCGIGDVCYFSKLFRKHTGHSPSSYRQQNKLASR